MKIHPVGEVVPCRQTDRHDEANSHFIKFVNMPKKGFFQLQLFYLNTIEAYLCTEIVKFH